MRYATSGMVLAGCLFALSGCQHPDHPAPARGAAKPAPAARTPPAPAQPTPAPPAGTVPAAPAKAAAPTDASAPAPKAPAKPKIVDPDRPKTPEGPGSTVNRITIHPAHPIAHQAIQVSAGPVLFRNTCEGIASVRVHRHRHTVTVAWTRKKVPPHVMCGMIVRNLPVTATIPGLPAGHYTLVVTEIGKRPLLVRSSRRR